MSFFGCVQSENPINKDSTSLYQDAILSEISLIVLGTIQDGGSPHIACKKACCKDLFEKKNDDRKVVSLGIIDNKNQKKYLFECTPDFVTQSKALLKKSNSNELEMPDGIFLTHTHIGHYSGLMYLGKEAMNAEKIPVYAMPRMKTFLENNGPWSQLVNKQNISIIPLQNNQKVKLSPEISVIQVPHRDEFSETVGFIIEGPNKKVLFIPDIDKWEKWETNIIKIINQVDYAFIDGTFYNGEEINNRNIAEIPHPFIIESMKLFENVAAIEKSKIHFIHFNHTNKALLETSDEYKSIISNGFHVAQINQVIKL
jgi:pyrroloquinoline quinone biosynthesis protein B